MLDHIRISYNLDSMKLRISGKHSNARIGIVQHGMIRRQRQRKRGGRTSLNLPTHLGRALVSAVRNRLARPFAGDPQRMNCIPHFGIRQIEQEYQQRYFEHVRRARISFAALLLSAGTHTLLIASLVRDVLGSSPGIHIDHVVPFAAAIVCLAPFTGFLARLHLFSRAEARRFRARLNELGASLVEWGAEPARHRHRPPPSDPTQSDGNPAAARPTDYTG